MDDMLQIDGVACKRCSRCHQYKSIYEFNMQNGEKTFRRQPYCRKCQHEYARENYAAAGGRIVRIVESDTKEERESYNELFSCYKRYRRTIDTYKEKYGGKGLEERLSFEYSLGF